jgi:hypothetical protein
MHVKNGPGSPVPNLTQGLGFGKLGGFKEHKHHGWRGIIVLIRTRQTAAVKLTGGGVFYFFNGVLLPLILIFRYLRISLFVYIGWIYLLINLIAYCIISFCILSLSPPIYLYLSVFIAS